MVTIRERVGIVTGRGPERGFWNASKFLAWVVVRWVCFLWEKFIELYTYDLCTFLHVSYTSIKKVYLKIYCNQASKQAVYILTVRI